MSGRRRSAGCLELPLGIRETVVISETLGSEAWWMMASTRADLQAPGKKVGSSCLSCWD